MLGIETAVAWFAALSLEAQLGLATAAGGSGLAAVKGGIWAWKALRRRLQFRKLNGKNPIAVEAFLDLYERVIEPRSRLDSTELVHWVTGDRKADGIEHASFGCYRDSEIVGFAQMIVCKSSGFAFIPYFGVDDAKKEITYLAASELARGLAKHLKRSPGIKFLLFEVDDPSEARLPSDEKAKRSARIRRLKSLCKLNRLVPMELDMSYTQPEMPSGAGSTHECSMRLVAVRTQGRDVQTELSKREVLEFIRFIYYRIYLPSYYQEEGELRSLYIQYLFDLLCTLENRIPPRVRGT